MPPAPLTSQLFSERLLSLPPSAVCRPSPDPVQTLSEETFLKLLTPTGEQGSLISLPETLRSGGRVLALGRATKNEVYPKEGNGCLWAISSFTVKGLLSSTHTPWAWDACRWGDQPCLEPGLPLSTLQPPSHDHKRQATNTASLCMSDTRLQIVTLLIQLLCRIHSGKCQARWLRRESRLWGGISTSDM